MLAEHSGLDGRHVVLADRQGEHRLWVRDPTPGKRLAVLIPLDADFQKRVASLMRFQRRLFGRPAGPQPRGWDLTRYRRDRLGRMLRALDLRLVGASYRDIAIALGEADAARMSATEWKMSRARSHVVRLVASGKAMMNGGYRKLLQGR